jgi:hypothetical protein
MVRVVATDEDAMLARHVRAVLEREEAASEAPAEIAAPLAVIAGAAATKKE